MYFYSNLQEYQLKAFHQMLEPVPEIHSIFYPRAIAAPGGYHSPKCAYQGLLELIFQNNYNIKTGRRPPLPTEITAHSITYKIIDHETQIYYVAEKLIRTVAAIEMPADLRMDELFWPMPGMIIGLPPNFLREFLGVDACYVYMSKLDLVNTCRRYPSMTIDAPKPGVGWFWMAESYGKISTYVTKYFFDQYAGTIATDYTYADYTGLPADKVADDKEMTDKMSTLLIKLLMVLSLRDGLVEHGSKIERKIKNIERKPFHRDLWQPNIIGRTYKVLRESVGTTGPRGPIKPHRRRGHAAWQSVMTKETKAEFVYSADLPRTDDGQIDWPKVPEPVRLAFLKTHKRVLIEPIMIGMHADEVKESIK